jgi:N-hydroxyarylamine O-acetyltransferase
VGFDLPAYLERIGLNGQVDLAAIHRAHVCAIPFENLDPYRGLPVSLDLDDLQVKLVTARRGGYCFEQNLLLKAALEAGGAEVDMFLARVRMGGEPGAQRPRTHLALGVRSGGAYWHADVGFGRGGLLEPIPFGPGTVYEQAGWRYRIVADGDEFVLQMATGDDWVDQYGFLPHPVPLIDVETSNWFTATHPRSLFVTSLMVSAQPVDSSWFSLSNRGGLLFSEYTPAGSTSQPLEPGAVGELLATRFSLPGFALEPDGRLVASADGR